MKFKLIVTLFLLIGNLFTFTDNAKAALYSFTTHTFTNCSATGASGPSLASCKTAYATSWSNDTSLFNVTSGIQYWTAPTSGTYQVTAAGAVGNGGGVAEGLGAIIRATVSLKQGTIYKILVGQAGSNGSGGSGGGGGGTFLADSANTPILVAGGGGGTLGSGGVNSSTLANGQTTTSGANSSDGTGTGGTSGNGGTGSNNGWGSGGGGFTGNGTAAANVGSYGYLGLGYSFINGGGGGNTASSAYGGFGGGAGTHGNTGGGGGGGGYSGGGGSNQNFTTTNGGGGGSFVISGATNIATSNGSYAGSSTGITNLASYNGTYGSSTLSAGYLTVTFVAPSNPATISLTAPSSVVFRTTATVTATSDSPGKVTFSSNGKYIAGCRNLLLTASGPNYVASCNLRATLHATINVTGYVVPSNINSENTSSPIKIFVTKRTGTR